MTNLARQQTMQAILDERVRQNNKWGEQNHDASLWMLIALEEIGEVAKTILEKDPIEYRKELIQATAVMFQWLECEYRIEQKRMTQEVINVVRDPIMRKHAVHRDGKIVIEDIEVRYDNPDAGANAERPQSDDTA